MKIIKPRMMNKSAPIALRRSKRLMQKKDILTNLPQEMMIEILRRLPIRSIITCTHVCESWHNLIKGSDFAMSYNPKPGFAFVHQSKGYAVCDEACKPLRRFNFPPQIEVTTLGCYRAVVGSANGLLLAWDGSSRCNEILFVCNPITGEYIEIPRLPTQGSVFGFGVSRLSGQYKILCGNYYTSCHMYTLGKGGGSWRRIGAAIGHPRPPQDKAVFLNGNLHWLTCDNVNGNFLICCFDLETELFTSFSLPRNYGDHLKYFLYKNREYRLCVLDGRLCLCDISASGSVVIWWLNNYGDANSWVKTFMVNRPDIHDIIFPLKVFENGDLLFTVKRDHFKLFTYSRNTRNLVIYGILRRSPFHSSNIVSYIPSFLSLKNMGIHNVQSLYFY